MFFSVIVGNVSVMGGVVARSERFRVVRGGRREDPKQAFERLYRESYPLVYNYIFRRVLDRTGAEDVTSEAFMRAARYFDRFDPERAKFSTWVISIARNCLNDYYERSRPTAPLESVSETTYAIEDSNVENILDADLAQKLLAVLDDDDRELMFMKFYEGKRNSEIAAELGINASTVSSRVARAIAKMREVVA